MQDGRSYEIIDRLIAMISDAPSSKLNPGKASVNREEALLLLKELKTVNASELKMYRELSDKRGRIIADARAEAEEIVQEAKNDATRIRVSKLNTGNLKEDVNTLQEDEKYALRQANDIYASALTITDEMLSEVNDVIESAYENVLNQYKAIAEVLEEKTKLVANNKTELMKSLKAMSTEERYAHILELSTLLSSELYNERKRELAQEEKMRNLAKMREEIESGIDRENKLNFEKEERVRQAHKKAVKAAAAKTTEKLEGKIPDVAENFKNYRRGKRKVDSDMKEITKSEDIKSSVEVKKSGEVVEEKENKDE